MNVATPQLEPDIAQPIKLRSLPAEAAFLQDRLARVFQPLGITEQGAQILAGLDAPRRPQEGVPWVHFTLDGTAGAVQVPWGVLRRLTGLAVEGAMPEDAALVLEDALSDALDQAESACGVTLRLVAIHAMAEGLPVSTTLNLQGKDAGGSFVQMRQPMLLSPTAASALAQALAPRLVQRDDLPGLALSLAWETDAIALAVADMKNLEVGDAVELSLRSTSGRVVVQGQQCAGATRDGNTVTLTTAFTPLFTDEETQMSETVLAETPPETRPETDVNDIEVRLSFRAGQTSLPLRTLREMGPGAVIEMTDAANAEVEIVANGRVVGAGELIDVAGRRAVQIRRLFTGA